MPDFTDLIKNLPESAYELSDEARYIYRTDTTKYEGMPDLILHITSIEDVQKAVKFANSRNIPIIARGAGSGMTGGVTAMTGGIVLNFEPMNKIISIDSLNKIAYVQPGVITADLEQAAKKQHLYYPPDPSSHKVSTIGGNVAENAGGLHCVKYGVTSRYVKGIKYINALGQLCMDGVYKPEEFSLGSFITGSEGTLGIIVEVALELIEAPIVAKSFLVFHQNMDATVKNVIEVKKSDVDPSVMELIDSSALLAITRYKPLPIPEDTDSVLLIEINADSLPELERKSMDLEKIIRSCTPIEYLSSNDANAEHEMWEVRRLISPSIKNLAPNKLNEDIVVPISEIPVFIKCAEQISVKYQLPIVVYGHAGDGNLHVNILFDKRNISLEKNALLATEDIFKITIELGGSITGEHGIGLSKKNFLSMQYDKNTIALMKKIKRAFDSANILNPGKIFNLN